jgi:hypothetical protein
MPSSHDQKNRVICRPRVYPDIASAEFWSRRYSMRKIGITAFVALYGFLILSITVARTSVWANQESDAIGQSTGAGGSSHITRVDKTDPPPSQKKWVESGFAVEMPQEATLDPTPSSYSPLLSIPEYRSNPCSPSVSSRAPPFQS